MTLTLPSSSSGISTHATPSKPIQAQASQAFSVQKTAVPTDTAVIETSKIQLRHDPQFDKLSLTPSVTHTPLDITEITKLNLRQVAASSRQTIENSRLSLLKRTPEERRAFFKVMEEYLPGTQPGHKTSAKPNLTMEKDITRPLWYYMLTKLGAVAANKSQAAFNLLSPYTTAIWDKRFIKNPQGGFVSLKNKEQNIIGAVGFNQFQNTHDHQITLGDTKAIDPKHSLEVSLYVKPEYRNMGVATALRKTMLDYARQKGYTHIWSTTEKDSSSQRINEKLGYQLAKSETRFKDSPAFTPDKMKSLIDEYSVGTRQLSWLNIPKHL